MLRPKFPSKTPPGGWQFSQPEVGWTAPNPLGDNYTMLARKVRTLRWQSPILKRLNLPTSLSVITQEIFAYNYQRVPDFFINTSLPRRTAANAAATVSTATKTSGCCGGAR